MSTRVRVARNALAILSIRVLTPLSALVIFIYASRVLDVSEIGKYSLLLAFFQMVQYLPVLGLNPYIVKEISKNRDLAAKYLMNVSVLSIAAAVAVGAGLFGAGVLLHYPPDVLAGLVVVGWVVLIAATALVCETVFISFERMELMAYVVIVESIFKMAASVWILHAGYGFLWLIGLLALSRLGATGAYLLILRGQGVWRGHSMRIDLPFVRELLKVSPVFLAINLCSTLINRVDFVLLSKLGSFEDLGFYTAGYRLLDLAVLATSTLVFAAYPLLARLHGSSASEFRRVSEKLIRYLMIFTVLTAALIFSFATPLITLFYTGSYLASASVLKILIWTAPLIALDQIYSSLFILSNRQKMDLTVLVAGILVYVVLLLVLIPAFGLYGAAAATVAGMLIQLTIRYFLSRKVLFSVNLLSIAWKPVIAGAAAVALAFLLKSVFWVLAAPLCAAFYVAVLFAVGALNREDWKLVRQVAGTKGAA